MTSPYVKELSVLQDSATKGGFILSYDEKKINRRTLVTWNCKCGLPCKGVTLGKSSYINKFHGHKVYKFEDPISMLCKKCTYFVNRRLQLNIDVGIISPCGERYTYIGTRGQQIYESIHPYSTSFPCK